MPPEHPQRGTLEEAFPTCLEIVRTFEGCRSLLGISFVGMDFRQKFEPPLGPWAHFIRLCTRTVFVPIKDELSFVRFSGCDGFAQPQEGAQADGCQDRAFFAATRMMSDVAHRASWGPPWTRCRCSALAIIQSPLVTVMPSRVSAA